MTARILIPNETLSYQARLLAFQEGAGVAVPAGFGPADINGNADDPRTVQATQFFQKAFNDTPPPAGFILAQPLPTTGDLSDPRTQLALRYDVDRALNLGSQLYARPTNPAALAPAAAAAPPMSTGTKVAIAAGGVSLLGGALWLAKVNKLF